MASKSKKADFDVVLIKLHSIAISGALALAGAGLKAAITLPESLPPHPRLLFTMQDLPAIRERIATEPWAKKRFESIKAQADDWLKRRITLPDRGGQWYHYYSCPKHGARLRNEGPTRHVCPIDNEVFTGYPYDDVYIAMQHDRFAAAVRLLGIVHQLSGDPRYAAKAKEILLAYADRYESYPLHNIRGEAKVGGGKVGPQTLDESTWLIRMMEGADCIWTALSSSEQERVKDKLIYPATKVIRQHHMGIHNIQCWKNSAVGLAGLLLGDMKLVDAALNADNGYFRQMEKGVSADGPWFEGAWGYHFYTISAVEHLTEGAFHCGINLYGPEFKRMFDAPVAMAMPDLELPAFNDSHTVRLPDSAAVYEVAYARYGDARYRAVLSRSGRVTDQALLYGRDDVGQAEEFQTTSTNFTASGNAILAAGRGAEAVWLCLDYGPHGGGHGHPDKLGFVLYGLDRILAPDPGTANYGVPIQSGWYRTTLAHNTLTVDERSQKPAQGRCEAFIAADGFNAVLASAGRIHDDVRFHRAAALIGTNLLVFLDLVSANQEHTYDLAYHNYGTFETPAKSRSFETPKKPGYSYLRDVRQLDSAAGLKLTFDLGSSGKIHWAMAGGPPTTFLTGTGVGRHTEDRVPVVIARRHASSTVWLWSISVGGSLDGVQTQSEPVRLAEGFSPTPFSAAAIRVTLGGETHLILANPGGVPIRLAGQTTGAKLAHFVAKPSGSFVLAQSAAP